MCVAVTERALSSSRAPRDRVSVRLLNESECRIEQMVTDANRVRPLFAKSGLLNVVDK